MSASGTHSNTTITYPIAFNTQCYSVASTREGTSADGTWNAVISNLTTTTFLCQLKIGLYWLAVGKQQWGIKEISTYTSFTNIQFPIAFTNIFCISTAAIAKTAIWWNPQFNKGPIVSSLTTVGFNTTLPSDTYKCDCCFIVLGN